MGKKAKTKGRDRGRHAPDLARIDGSPMGSNEASTELAASLVGIGAQIGRQLGHGTDEDGLTSARLSALGRLVLGGPCTLGQLAAHEGVRPPTMTRLVHSMEAAGLVTRARHPTDRRSIVLHATPVGEALLASGQASLLAPLTGAIDALDRDERRELARASTIIDRFLRDVNGARRRG
jgi:DNA-binding MarR family transcriptional regulator